MRVVADDSNSDDDNVLLPPEGRVISGEHIGDVSSIEVPSERGVRQSRQAVNPDEAHDVSGVPFTSLDYFDNILDLDYDTDFAVREFFDVLKVGDNPSQYENDIQVNLSHRSGGTRMTFTGGLGDIQQNEAYSSLTYQRFKDYPTNGWGNTYMSTPEGTPRSTERIGTKMTVEHTPTSKYVGHTICAVLQKNINETSTIDKSENIKQAEIDFRKNVIVVENELNRIFPFKMSQNMFNALADMCFPLGEHAFSDKTNWGFEFGKAIIRVNEAKYTFLDILELRKEMNIILIAKTTNESNVNYGRCSKDFDKILHSIENGGRYIGNQSIRDCYYEHQSMTSTERKEAEDEIYKRLHD